MKVLLTTCYRRLAPGLVSVLFLVTVFLHLCGARADDTWVYSVQLKASVQTSPPQIHLNWIPDKYGAISYTVYRRDSEDSNWGWGTVLSGTTSNFVDTDVLVGQRYEYQVVKQGVPGYTSYGYISSGIQVPAVHDRGAIVVVIANSLLPALAAEIERLRQDLTGDGWRVIQHTVATNQSPAAVRSLIVDDYHQHPNVEAVLLLGRVPVLLSGNLNYDTHQARPMPADAFYGDMDGDWSNSPGFLPSDVELMVGRVDLFDMPGASSPTPFPNEIELTRRYLNKDHAWRHGQVVVPRRALMGDRRGVDEGYAPAASGYRSFDPLVGHGAITIANTADSAPAAQRWISRLANDTYLWAYGCGGGLPTGISHLGTRGRYFEAWTTDVVNLDAKAVFVMLYGSWFGNWERKDNFMRSFLATPSLGLACVMSGEPHWFMHPMGLGDPIGRSARLTMNNATLYGSDANPMNRAVYVALMGDPTLRMHPFPPPSNLSATQQSGVHLSWSPAPAPVLGYHVYRSTQPDGPFSLINQTPVAPTVFIDSNAPPGEIFYMVRAVRDEVSPSGTFFNLSQGTFASVQVTAPPAPIHVNALLVDDGVLLQWNTQAGLSYRVFGSADIYGTNWIDLSGPRIAPGDTAEWLDVQTHLPQRYYRVSTP